MLSADSFAVSRSMSSISMNWARIASSFGRLICCWPPKRPPNIIIATPPIMKIGKIEPAPRNIREPLATVMPTMPTSRPTTSTPTTISHHGLPSGGGTLSGVGRTMFSGLTAGALFGRRACETLLHLGTTNSAGFISVGRVSWRTSASARDSAGPGASRRNATHGAGDG